MPRTTSRREPRWQRRPDARPDEILEAAISVFGEVGFARAKLEDVARRAGVSKGTVYLYFDSKDALFRAMVRGRVVSRFEASETELVQLGESARVALTRFLHGMWDIVRTPEMARLVRLVHSELSNFPELARFYFDEVILRVRGAVRVILDRGVATGEFRRVNHDFAVRAVASLMVHGAMSQRFFAAHDPQALTDDQVIDGIVDTLFHGLLRREPA